MLGTLIRSDSASYDRNGNVLTETDGDGNVTSYTYDGMNRAAVDGAARCVGDADHVVGE